MMQIPEWALNLVGKLVLHIVEVNDSFIEVVDQVTLIEEGTESSGPKIHTASGNSFWLKEDDKDMWIVLEEAEVKYVTRVQDLSNAMLGGFVSSAFKDNVRPPVGLRILRAMLRRQVALLDEDRMRKALADWVHNSSHHNPGCGEDPDGNPPVQNGPNQG